MFAMLQDKIYELGMSTDSNNIEIPTSFLEIGEPEAALSTATRKAYDKITLSLALQDAKEKFEATMVLAGVKSYKIINYSENFKQPGISRGNSRSVADEPSSPVEFGNINIEKSLSVQFEYVGGDLNIL